MNSHDLELDAMLHPPRNAMNALEQEAKSKRYGNETVLIVPLSNGQWGVFDRAWQYVGVLETNYEKVRLADGTITTLRTVSATARDALRPTQQEQYSFSLEDYMQ